MFKIIGILGSILLGGSALPQAIASYRTKSSKGLDVVFLMTWLLGEICLITYVAGTTQDFILLGNYIFNLACLAVILKYR